MSLEGYQRKYLRGLAHELKPVVLVGQRGLTDALLNSLEEALNQHELIKVKFNDFKESADKKAMIAELAEACGCEPVGLIGHTAILYRPHPQPEKRRIHPPQR
jgi:RNA-binding protein